MQCDFLQKLCHTAEDLVNTRKCIEINHLPNCSGVTIVRIAGGPSVFTGHKSD